MNLMEILSMAKARPKEEDAADQSERTAGRPRYAPMMADFALAIESVAKAWGHGAETHGAHQWRHLENAEEIFTSKAIGHLLADLRGDGIDEDSGLLHLEHAAWNILAVLELRRSAVED